MPPVNVPVVEDIEDSVLEDDLEVGNVDHHPGVPKNTNFWNPTTKTLLPYKCSCRIHSYSSRIVSLLNPFFRRLLCSSRGGGDCPKIKLYVGFTCSKQF